MKFSLQIFIIFLSLNSVYSQSDIPSTTDYETRSDFQDLLKNIETTYNKPIKVFAWQGDINLTYTSGATNKTIEVEFPIDKIVFDTDDMISWNPNELYITTSGNDVATKDVDTGKTTYSNTTEFFKVENIATYKALIKSLKDWAMHQRIGKKLNGIIGFKKHISKIDRMFIKCDCENLSFSYKDLESRNTTLTFKYKCLQNDIVVTVNTSSITKVKLYTTGVEVLADDIVIHQYKNGKLLSTSRENRLVAYADETYDARDIYYAFMYFENK